MNSRAGALLLLAMLAVLPMRAEVYLLGPRRGTGAPVQSFAETSGAAELMTEPAVFNGVETELRVLLLRQPPSEVLAELRRRFAELAVFATPGGIALRWPAGKGRHERILLAGGGGLGDTTTVFSMILPDAMPPAPAWAEGLPPVPGATALEVVELPVRGSRMVTFAGGAGAAPAAERSLRAEGFLPLGGGVGPGSAGGALYLDAAGREMVMLSIQEDGSGMMLRSRLGR